MKLFVLNFLSARAFYCKVEERQTGETMMMVMRTMKDDDGDSCENADND